jgi:transposase
MNTSSAHSFKIPYGIQPSKRTDYCIGVIERYRLELPQIRRAKTILKTQISRLEEEIEYWKKQYKKEKEENEKLQDKNNKLKQEYDKLNQEIERLTKTSNRYRIALFDHGNFKSPLEDKKEDKKQKGGQLGHIDTNRERRENYSSFKHERLFAKTCGKCHHMLSRVESYKQKVLIDIVINPQVVKMILESERQWCPHCKMEVNARDARSIPFTEYGINTFMMIIILRFKCHSSMKNIGAVLEISHGIKLSKSDVSNILLQAKIHLKTRYEELKKSVRSGNVMFNDETGWLVNGESAWMWIMASDEATVYFASESRGKGIAEELYGESTGFSMHDGFVSYKNSIPKDKQCYCWAHFLRFAFEETILEKKNSASVFLRNELVKIYRLKKEHPEYSLEKLKNFLDIRLTNILKIESTNIPILKIQERLEVQKEGLVNGLLFTEDGTNNLSERELRPLVINKKIQNGSNTFEGMETTAVLGSIVQTISRSEKGKYENDFIQPLKNYLQKGVKEKSWQYSHTAFIDSS